MRMRQRVRAFIGSIVTPDPVENEGESTGQRNESCGMEPKLIIGGIRRRVIMVISVGRCAAPVAGRILRPEPLTRMAVTRCEDRSRSSSTLGG